MLTFWPVLLQMETCHSFRTDTPTPQPAVTLYVVLRTSIIQIQICLLTELQIFLHRFGTSVPQEEHIRHGEYLGSISPVNLSADPAMPASPKQVSPQAGKCATPTRKTFPIFSMQQARNRDGSIPQTQTQKN